MSDIDEIIKKGFRTGISTLRRMTFTSVDGIFTKRLPLSAALFGVSEKLIYSNSEEFKAIYYSFYY
jgi:hypothetical protein